MVTHPTALVKIDTWRIQMIRTSIIAALVSLCAGCATFERAPTHSDIAEADVSGQGVVVGKVIYLHENFFGKEKFGNMGALDASIFGDRATPSSKDGSFDTPLAMDISDEDGVIEFLFPAGSYELYTLSGYDGTYGLRRNFSVSEKTITNLGIFLLIESDEKANQYMIYTVADNDQLDNHIRTTFDYLINDGFDVEFNPMARNAISESRARELIAARFGAEFSSGVELF